MQTIRVHTGITRGIAWKRTSERSEIIDLSREETDFLTPAHICAAAEEAMANGHTKYTPVRGYPGLIEAITTKLRRDNGLNYENAEVIVSTGEEQALANVILSVINPGDEVIIPTPCTPAYAGMVRFAGGRPKWLPCNSADSFKLQPRALADAITPRTRMFLLSSPCNPTGAVYNKEELAAIAAVLEAHPAIMVVTDETYEYFNYSEDYAGLAAFGKLKGRTAIINGMSQGFAMSGWRIGYMAGPKWLVAACEKLQGQFTSGANSVAQYAAAAALTASQKERQDMVATFLQRRNYFVPALNSIAGIETNFPGGGYYAFPSVEAFMGTSDGTTNIDDDEDLATYLAETTGIKTLGGSSFGLPNRLRISFAAPIGVLKAVSYKMRDALARLEKQ